jgi:hypothetical protein
MICYCRKTNTGITDALLLSKVQDVEDELVVIARNILRGASDPLSAVIKFLQERPENASLTGYVMDRVLTETFGEREKIPSLVKVLASHVREIIRQSNVINIINEHPAAEKWGDYIIKQTERIKFEISKERDLLVLKNIAGIFAVEHGVQIPIECITIKPPKLIVTLNLGIIRPNRIVDI